MNTIFSGVPRIESPVFDADDPDAAFNAEERHVALDLNTRGYAVIDFPDPELNDRIERIKADLGPHYGLDLTNPETDKTIGERRIQDAWRINADVRAIASNTAIIDMLSRLYGRTAFPFQTLNFPVGTEQGAHSDSAHFSSFPERFMCGVWLAMEDVGADAGPLFYYPGSHRWPIVNNGMLGRRGYDSNAHSAQTPYEPAWQALRDAHGTQAETFLARKGQALIWCANLLHGGSRQNNPKLTRWSQVTHYYFENCIYYTPAFSDEATGRLALRNIISISDGQPRDNKYLEERIIPPDQRRRRWWQIGSLNKGHR
ncbi:phytanoyl-CoA dioxygenase family protein [Sphingomonas sp.]|uniref:phytanoyl-CoA dioxygenase family protein n=1 Tax=Sphingomonas sp. TaxID=28214 RepID=UPI0028AF230C|nr:phytanoyl-CoA dioxygenase family protein [Sphingomonas sp.]